MISAPARGTIALMAWLTVSAAADRSKLSRTHLRRLITDGVLKGVKVGPLWTVDERSLTRYLATDRRPGRVPKKPR